MDEEENVGNLRLVLSSSDEDEEERRVLDHPLTRKLADMKTEVEEEKFKFELIDKKLEGMTRELNRLGKYIDEDFVQEYIMFWK